MQSSAGLAVAGGIYALSRRELVDAHNVNEVPLGAPKVAAATSA